MRVVVAPDSFKECLRAAEVAEAIAAGVRRARSDAEVLTVPMTDGGQGLLASLRSLFPIELYEEWTVGPMGAPVSAAFGILELTVDGAAQRLGIVEMAAASGLELVSPADRNPLVATTFGTGQLMRAAVAAGAQRLLVGIGGSATNDGGAGMAQALGWKLRDAAGRDLPYGGAALARLAEIVPPDDDGWRPVPVEVACDVTNVLCGPTGASAVYGPQKGATPAMVAELDAALGRLQEVARRRLGVDRCGLPGGGAAGGLGAGLVAFTGANLRRGVE
ncbi:MAG: glycerate kinase, partial [Planctomycetia bacterium]